MSKLVTRVRNNGNAPTNLQEMNIVEGNIIGLLSSSHENIDLTFPLLL